MVKNIMITHNHKQDNIILYVCSYKKYNIINLKPFIPFFFPFFIVKWIYERIKSTSGISRSSAITSSK